MTNIIVEKGMPRKGWKTIDVVDHEKETTKCSLCGTTTIRHEHFISHPNWPTVVTTGCVCAEHLSKDYFWRNKLKWKDGTNSDCDISYTTHKKKTSVVVEQNGVYTWFIFDKETGDDYDSRRIGRIFATFDEAQDDLYQVLEDEEWL
jgi:hypothetical protein